MEIAVLIPCYNEALTIQQVVSDVKRVLPQASVWVYDNNSGDKTYDVALASGAFVYREKNQGKGNVVRRMFADIEADVYVLIDGDATYDVASIPVMIQKLTDECLDTVTGVRCMTTDGAYRSGHQLGNRLMTKIVQLFFGFKTRDMLSGLRVFSRRFVKSFPAHSKGFEIETELTVFASSMRMPAADYETPYYARPEGSVSKLSTFKDGFKILKMIVQLIWDERPMLFFGCVSAGLFLLSLIGGGIVLMTYLETGLVPRLPLAVLSASLALCGGVAFAIALILDGVTSNRREIRRLTYLSYPFNRQKGK